MKQIKLMAVALLLVVLVSMPAFAASTMLTSPSAMAYEILGGTRSFNVVSATVQKPIPIVLGNGLVNGDTVNLSLSGGAVFTGGYNLCAANGDAAAALNDSSMSTQLGTGSLVTNTTLAIPITYTSGAAIGSGERIWITSASCGAIGTTVLGAANFQVVASSSVGYASMNGTATALAGGLRTVINAANVLSIVRQVGTTLNTAALIGIDYLSGAANGSGFVASGFSSNVVAGSNSLMVANAAPTYGLASVGASFNQLLTLTDSHGGDWSGITRVYAVTNVNGEALCSGTAVANATIASGNITLQIPNATNAMGLASNALGTTLCVNVAAGNVIPSRNIYGAYSYVVSAGSLLNVPPGAGSSSIAWQSWTPNGYQAFNPYMYVGTSQDTMDVFCRFYNSSPRTATAFVDVYPADGTAYTRHDLGTILPNTAATYWGSTIGASASLAVGTSYAALFTITAPPSQINGVSFFKRSTGDRQLSLYKQVYSTDQYLSQ